MRTSSTTTDTCRLFTEAAAISLATGAASICIVIAGELGEVVRTSLGLLGVLGIAAATRLYALRAMYKRQRKEVQRRVAEYRNRHSVTSLELQRPDLQSPNEQTRVEQALAAEIRLWAEAEANATKLRDECNAAKGRLKTLGSHQSSKRSCLCVEEVVTALQQLLADCPQGVHRDNLLALLRHLLCIEQGRCGSGLTFLFRRALQDDLFVEVDGVVRLARFPRLAE